MKYKVIVAPNGTNNLPCFEKFSPLVQTLPTDDAVADLMT
jgi:hypothetical protein